ncbi:HK97-gp10 family putative phage morphogenesis protein [Dolosicoccus paucivorans]|uniref:HK97-gp10 family putative phage morphogenesis protein n=1 Tax=Dolosicoccus paucivorans TaxID=84521 RepID=UPI00088E9430|nr:HK97-gp10 family putative phage morphogenesis protein [Dolosicoccus paucivorans]SDI41112.1 phage protein, HK97 gp10 family [Dolosicoccus paucivorans]
MSFRIELKGATEIQVHLKKAISKELIKQVVRTNGADLNAVMVRNAVFVRGYSTGATRRSITLSLDDGGLTARVKPGTHYSVYVEYGTYKMTPQPFVRPSFNTVKTRFISDIERVMK